MKDHYNVGERTSLLRDAFDRRVLVSDKELWLVQGARSARARRGLSDGMRRVKPSSHGENTCHTIQQSYIQQVGSSSFFKWLDPLRRISFSGTKARKWLRNGPTCMFLHVYCVMCMY